MLKMRAFELFPRPNPSPEPGKVQTYSFWSFQPPKSSKCARLNFSQGRTLPRAWKSSNALFVEFSAPEKLKMRAFELFPRPNPSPSLEKFKRAHFGVFSPEKLKMCAFELSQGEPFPEPGKVQTRSFWSSQPPKSSECACAFELSPRPNPSPSLEKFKRAHFGVFSPRKAQNVRV